jgi:predicted RecA/RadA family phage recombinase
MTDLVVTATTFHVVQSIEQDTLPAAAAITAGAAIYVNTSGKWALAKATTATLGGHRTAIAAKTVAAGQSLTGVYKGVVDAPGALDALAFDAYVYLSDTATGILADAAGTVTIIMGVVVPGWASGATPDKLLRING